MTYYAGIGSRKTPDTVQRWMRIYAEAFAKLGFILRSGAAPGADTAFEEGCDRVNGPKEILLPWKNFSKHPSPLCDVTDKAMDLSEQVWNNKQYETVQWKYIKRPVKLLLARDIQQILGVNLDQPVSFVVCWTADGCTNWETRSAKTGGTGHAIDLASTLGIPIFNLQSNEDEFLRFLGKYYPNGVT